MSLQIMMGFIDIHISCSVLILSISLQWRHNEHDGVSNHRRLDGLFNRLLRRKSTKTSQFDVTDLCEGNPPVSGEFHSQGANNAEMFPFDDVIMCCV